LHDDRRLTVVPLVKGQLIRIGYPMPQFVTDCYRRTRGQTHFRAAVDGRFPIATSVGNAVPWNRP
jgi:hypothetical protein